MVLGENVRRSFGRMRDRAPPPTHYFSRHRIKIETRGRRKIWKRNKQTRNARPRTTIDARTGAPRTGLDLNIRQRQEKENFDSGCGLKKERGMMRGERDR